MSKKKYIKIFITLITISTLTLFLTGCIVFIPPMPMRPIVEIRIINDNWEYDIYVDGKYEGTTRESGKLTLYTINEGYHHFEAEDTSSLKRYGEKWQTIKSGYNKVDISTE
ncbi:MAG: hypothetical protein WAW45_07600 [Atribacterota bacterium]